MGIFCPPRGYSNIQFQFSKAGQIMLHPPNSQNCTPRSVVRMSQTIADIIQLWVQVYFSLPDFHISSQNLNYYKKNCIQLKVKSIKWCQLRCWDNWRFSIKWVQMYFPPSDMKNKNLNNHNKIASKVYGCVVLSEWVGVLSDNQGHNSVMSAKSWSKLSLGSASRAICQLWQPACRNWILTFGPKSNRILTGRRNCHHFVIFGVFEWCTGWRHWSEAVVN